MSPRTALLALGLSLLAAGAAAAKPPGLPAEPPPDWAERTPVEREFYLPIAATQSGGVVGPVGGRGPVTAAERAAWRALNRLPADLLGLALPRLDWY